MTEADEVAASLLEQWFRTEGASLSEFVRAMLPDSSEVLISEVFVSLDAMILERRHDGTKPHVWKLGVEVGMKPTSILADLNVCADCGVLQGSPKYPETACKGKIKVKPRSE